MPVLRSSSRPPILVGCLALCLAGCTAAFNAREAREVTRDKLVQLADAGAGDHLHYQGSDRVYHYVYDTRPEKAASYKVRAEQLRLKDTFDVGEAAYPLQPWVIEGKLLGSKPQVTPAGFEPALQE